jgi:hypothetical protein
LSSGGATFPALRFAIGRGTLCVSVKNGGQEWPPYTCFVFTARAPVPHLPSGYKIPPKRSLNEAPASDFFRGRGPFGYAQGRLFDLIECSERNIQSALRKTELKAK